MIRPKIVKEVTEKKRNKRHLYLNKNIKLSLFMCKILNITQVNWLRTVGANNCSKIVLHK
jgi:hypothetical protein